MTEAKKEIDFGCDMTESDEILVLFASWFNFSYEFRHPARNNRSSMGNVISPIGSAENEITVHTVSHRHRTNTFHETIRRKPDEGCSMILSAEWCVCTRSGDGSRRRSGWNEGKSIDQSRRATELTAGIISIETNARIVVSQRLRIVLGTRFNQVEFTMPTLHDAADQQGNAKSSIDATRQKQRQQFEWIDRVVFFLPSRRQDI